jgi:hypothetical protein
MEPISTTQPMAQHPPITHQQHHPPNTQPMASYGDVGAPVIEVSQETFKVFSDLMHVREMIQRTQRWANYLVSRESRCLYSNIYNRNPQDPLLIKVLFIHTFATHIHVDFWFEKMYSRYPDLSPSQLYDQLLVDLELIKQETIAIRQLSDHCTYKAMFEFF